MRIAAAQAARWLSHYSAPPGSHLANSLRRPSDSSSLRGMLDAARNTSASHISAEHTAGRSLLPHRPCWGT